MKNVSVKLIAGAAVLGIVGAVYSFTSDNKQPDKPQSKKYEVIRMVDGETTQYDTIVTDASTYSPDDYLNDLGFGDDKNVRIIDLLEFEPEKAFGQKEMKKVIENDETKDNHMMMIEINEDVSATTETNENGHQEIRIEKRITKNTDGEEEIDLEVDVESLIEDLNLDSLMEVAMVLKGDSDQVFIHKVIITKEEYEGEGGHQRMEWHEMDTEGAAYHKKINEPGHHLEVAVWGNEDEDFTMVIVTDPETSTNRSLVPEGEEMNMDFKLYPNPAKTISQLQFNFEHKAPTSVTISDIKGRIIAKMELGEFSGTFNKNIDVSKWTRGVYIVQVEHGSDKIIEKLIVE